MNVTQTERHTILASYKARVKHPFIRAWLFSIGIKPSQIVQQVHKAAVIDAPSDAIYIDSYGQVDRLRDVCTDNLFHKLIKFAELKRWIELRQNHMTDFPF